MVAIDFTPRGVCSKNIHVELDDAGETIERIEFTGGCNGNLKAISKLVAGQSVEHVTQILRGNTCGPRKTSCADQLCCALDAAQAEARAQSQQNRTTSWRVACSVRWTTCLIGRGAHAAAVARGKVARREGLLADASCREPLLLRERAWRLSRFPLVHRAEIPSKKTGNRRS